MFLRMTTSALAFGLIAGPALSLTPEELWATWSAYYAKTGYTVTEGAREAAGETLTLKDVTLTQEAVPGDKIAVAMPEIVMTGTGDGGVRSTFGPGATITLDTKNGEGEPVVVTVSMKMDGAEVVSKGDATAHSEAITAPLIVMKVDKIDLPQDPDLTDVATVTLTGTTGTQEFADGGKSVTSSFKSEKLDYVIAFKDEKGDSLNGGGSIAGIEGGGGYVTSAEGVMDFGAQMSKALRAGAAFNGALRMGAGTHKLDFAGKNAETNEPTSGTMNMAQEGGDLTFKLDASGIGYQGSATGIDVAVTSSQMPFPIAYKLAEASFDLQGPVLKTDAPAPFKFAYSIGGLSVNDQIWDAFDPTRQLPRDPASIDIDLTGNVSLKADLFDEMAKAAQAAEGMAEGTPGATTPDTTTPEATPGATDGATPEATPGADGATPAAEAPMPFVLHDLAINNVAIDMVGVKAAANGALTIPEGGSIEAPVGKLDAKISGVNGLLDKLVGMGLISQDDVMGYRMMLTMFTKPGPEGGDNLVSQIEMSEGGGVTVNGQKVK